MWNLVKVRWHSYLLWLVLALAGCQTSTEGDAIVGTEGDAFKRELSAAAAGDMKAQAAIGIRYEEGVGVAADEEKAAYWMRKAAAQGDAATQNRLGLLIYNKPKEAAQWYRKAAEQGHAPAQVNLGIHYMTGAGVKRDDSEAAFWFRKAAELGDAAGQNNLALMLRSGRGVPQNCPEALAWLQKAVAPDQASQARQFSDAAMAQLGNMYRDGECVDRDERRAVEWFRSATALDGMDGVYGLAKAYATGHGVEQDVVVAVALFKTIEGQTIVDRDNSLYELSFAIGWDASLRADALAREMREEGRLEALARYMAGKAQE